MRKSSVEVNLASKLPCVVSVDVEGTLISGEVEYLGNYVCHATFVCGSYNANARKDLCRC